MRFFVIFAIFLFACQSGSQNPPQESIEANSAAFSLHEWGLIRITTGGSEVATSGPHGLGNGEPINFDNMQVLKPLIYLDPLAGFDLETEISVEVGLANGTLHEVWPVAEVTEFGSTHTFGPLQIINEGCGTENVPSQISEFCLAITTTGGICETAEMHEYLRPVQHCLQTPIGSVPVLLYNGIFDSTIDSISIEYSALNTTVTNTGSFPIGPLWAVSTDENIRYYHRIDQLQPNASQTFLSEEHTFGENEHEALISDISTTLIELGLTENEAADFIDAWRPNILAPRALNALPNSPWLAFGFFDPSFIDATLPMNVTPTPAETIRVLAFSLETQAQ